MRKLPAPRQKAADHSPAIRNAQLEWGTGTTTRQTTRHVSHYYGHTANPGRRQISSSDATLPEERLHARGRAVRLRAGFSGYFNDRPQRTDPIARRCE